MRLPALRLPAWRPSFDFLEGLGGRRVLLYGLYTMVLFAVFLVANFPYKVIVQRVLQSIDLPGMRLDVADGRFAWWRGYELQHVRLVPPDPDRAAFAEASSIFVRPGLDGLLRGKLNSVLVSALMYGGEVDATLASADGTNRAIFTIDGVQLQRYPLVANFLQDGTLAGRLSGVVTLEGRGLDPNDARAAGELYLDKVSLTDAKFMVFPLPALHFDKTTMKFSLQSGRLDVQEFEANGPDLRLSLNGQIAMRDPVGDSVLNLKLTALPGTNAAEDVRNLLALLPPLPKGAKPDAPHVVSGTLLRPRVR